MLINSIKKQKEELYWKGFVDGFAEVIAQRYFEKIEMAEKMLRQGLEIPLIVQKTDLDEGKQL